LQPTVGVSVDVGLQLCFELGVGGIGWQPDGQRQTRFGSSDVFRHQICRGLELDYRSKKGVDGLYTADGCVAFRNSFGSARQVAGFGAGLPQLLRLVASG
jgi:hypothetical protein